MENLVALENVNQLTAGIPKRNPESPENKIVNHDKYSTFNETIKQNLEVKNDGDSLNLAKKISSKINTAPLN